MFEFVEGSRTPLYHLRDSKYLRAEILLRALGKLHLLLADTHVLPHAKLGLATRTPRLRASILFHIARTSESVTRDGAMPVAE